MKVAKHPAELQEERKIHSIHVQTGGENWLVADLHEYKKRGGEKKKAVLKENMKINANQNSLVTVTNRRVTKLEC